MSMTTSNLTAAMPATAFTLFARREPTTDSFAISVGAKSKLDLVLYEDKDCTKAASRYPWFYSRPTRANKRVMHNCTRYNLEWLPDLKAA
jgi:hypothetical protein